MDAKTYFRVSAINLSFLLAGVLIGPPVVSTGRYVFDTVIHAQAKENPDKPPAKVEASKSPPVPSCDEAHFECIAPGISTGAAAFGTVLANRIASDQLMVNGFDPLKLHDATLAKLQSKGLLSAAEVQQIVDSAKVAKPLRVQIR
jgi:hypothetical protein